MCLIDSTSTPNALSKFHCAHSSLPSPKAERRRWGSRAGSNYVVTNSWRRDEARQTASRWRRYAWWSSMCVWRLDKVTSGHARLSALARMVIWHSPLRFYHERVAIVDLNGYIEAIELLFLRFIRPNYKTVFTNFTFAISYFRPSLQSRLHDIYGLKTLFFSSVLHFCLKSWRQVIDP